MDNNKYLNSKQQLLLRKYEKQLCPFGQKVLATLIQLKSEAKNKVKCLNQPLRYSNPNQTKRIITFKEHETHKTPSVTNYLNTPNDITDENYDFPFISTSIDLLTTVDNKNNPNKTPEIIKEAETEPIHTITLGESSLLDNTDSKIQDDDTSNEAEVIPWNYNFDTEIFEYIDDSDTDDPKNMDKLDSYGYNSNSNILSCINDIKLPGYSFPDDKTKRKRNTKVHKVSDASKKIKSKELTKNKQKNIFRKEKYRTTVKNWLNDVDPNNIVEEEESEILDIVTFKNTRNTTTCVDSPEAYVTESVPKMKKTRKTIQAQLANKDGIMKFKKPVLLIEDNTSKNVMVHKVSNGRRISNLVDEAEIVENTVVKTVKEKKIGKFVAPIKSQLPVKDVKFMVAVINDKNFNEYKNKLDEIKDGEIVVILTYRNGFNQLNCQHTDDSCVSEGILFQFNQHFFHLQGKINGCNETLQNILMTNTLISYEAKDLIIYLKCQFQISLTSLKVVDIKIGSSLINPDEQPEHFSDVQKLLEYRPEFTIASDCTLQKGAWYITLLKECCIKLTPLLIKNGLWKVFVDIEMKVLPIVADMQHRGVSVDLVQLQSMEHILLSRLNEIEAECHKAAGKTFQINSTVQVRTILYEELKLDTKSNVKIRETICKGAKSTSETMLRSLTAIHPLPKLILEYRHIHKAHATFLAGIAQHVIDGEIVKPTWDQTAAATGRIASNNPNLQAIPKTPFNLMLFPKEDGGDVNSERLRFRCIYKARAGHELLAADFRHVECRVFARCAADAGLLRALSSPDLFRVLAAEWLNKLEADISSEDRERTKRIVYASLYGAGTRKLMDILNLGYDQVLSIMSSFNRTFPSLKTFGRSVVAECEKQSGRLKIASGRARTFTNINSLNFTEKSHAERQAVNFVIQGTAADLCKKAMILTMEELRQSDPPIQGHLLLQIHDELVWEVLYEDMDRAAVIIKHAMETCGLECGMDLTLPVTMYRGPNWGEMEEFTPNISNLL